MYIDPISEPKTMIPATAATQNVRRDATWRSYSGLRARRWRRRNATSAAAATTNRPMTSAPLFGTAAKLIPRMSAPTRKIESTPPAWSTGSLVSFTWAGTSTTAITRPIAASGSVSRKTEPHQKCSSRIPEQSGPRAAIAPPVAAHSAIDFVRAGPDQSAAISASVVGYAIPAASPPRTRAPNRNSTDGAQAASRSAGTVRIIPRTSRSLRP